MPRETITNETSVIQRRFSTDLNMVDSVKIILKDYLKVDLAEKPLIADKTKHSYGFLGNLKKPFSTLVWLASKAMPERGLAGFSSLKQREVSTLGLSTLSSKMVLMRCRIKLLLTLK